MTLTLSHRGQRGPEDDDIEYRPAILEQTSVCEDQSEDLNQNDIARLRRSKKRVATLCSNSADGARKSQNGFKRRKTRVDGWLEDDLSD